jgi:hypothetical protein
VYLFEIHGHVVAACPECGLTSSSPSPISRDGDRFAINLEGSESQGTSLQGKTQVEASRHYLRVLAARSHSVRDILLVAEPGHCFAALAKDLGFSIVRDVSIAELQKEAHPSQQADAVVVIYQLEKANEVETAMDQIYETLKPGGVLFIVALSLDSTPARLFGQSWIGWRPENRYYFDDTTIQSLLWKSGFRQIRLDKDLRVYSLAHIVDRARSFPQTWITGTVKLAYRFAPSRLRETYFRLPTSGTIITATKAPRRERPVVSVIVPVYNESATFPALIDQLISKQINGLDKEIIVVESNSSDDSRQLVIGCKHRPDIKVILQEEARGKGNAVREGFEHATGDIVLIQDADLEYDMNDYAALLEPVAAFRRPFVLGSRHGGRWKMRQFDTGQHLSTYLNLGHLLFTALLNVLYGQHLRDPFTMFKVFRRDCLYNLRLECDRFDFDFELVIKLIRKGYTPAEIPVNYYSRSFKEGKKVQMFRDPLTWIKAAIKYRFVNIYNS